MDNQLNLTNTKIYDKCGLHLSSLSIENESEEYAACQFKLNDLKIIYRNAKTTPKKSGQFVTFWKRIGYGPIEPFHDSDAFNFFVVHVQTGDKSGQFVFPKSILIKKGIISTTEKEGKRAFRVYPSWDVVHSKQAIHTQKWQLNYFFTIDDSIDLNKVAEFYKNE